MSEGVFWLVEADPSAAGQGDLGDASPAGLVKWALEGDPCPFEFLSGCVDVLTKEIELETVLLIGRMDRDLRGRKRED
jgi:hypothetical protein